MSKKPIISSSEEIESNQSKSIDLNIRYGNESFRMFISEGWSRHILGFLGFLKSSWPWSVLLLSLWTGKVPLEALSSAVLEHLSEAPLEVTETVDRNDP